MALLSNSTLVILAISLLIYSLITRIINWHRLRHIPGPPLAGWSKLWLLRHAFSGKLCTKLEEISDKHGPLVRIAPGWVVCSDPAEIRRIWSINSGYYRGNWYKASRLNPNEDNVLTVSDNKAHHRLRAILGPAYAAMGNMEAKTHDQGMEATHEQIVDGQIEKLLALLERKYLSTPGGALQPCNIARIMQYLTQDVITTIGYGKAAGYLDVDKDIFGVIEACETVLLPAHLISFLPTLQNLLATPLLRPFIPKPTDTHPIGRFLAFIKAHVDEHYANNDEKNRSDVLHTFVNSKLSPTEVESEALVLLFGGTDTTATGLRNIIFFLSTNPRAYRLLQAEIDAAVQYGSRPIISDKHAKQLPYLQACIREGLRLWPPSMGVMGKISDRDNIVCGMKIPAGTQVGWAALPIMKDRSVFGDDAHVFEPARWIDADPAKSKEMEAVYGLVFATGTRWECLGKKLAYVELGKVIFELFYRFDFAMVKPMEPFRWMNHGLTAQFDMNVKITRRESR